MEPLMSGGTWIGVARMDFNLPEIPADFKTRLEDLVNAEVVADRRVAVRVLPRAEALALPDIVRTQTNLIPADEQEIRVVDIVGLDVQADGGTHVASTKQIGCVRVKKVESKGRANRRVRIEVVD
jgi:misacylated tRNA(Ala) deacylase